MADELEVPRLLDPDEQPSPAVSMTVDVPADVLQLLRCCRFFHDTQRAGPWDPVLPIYPTSPVGTV